MNRVTTNIPLWGTDSYTSPPRGQRSSGSSPQETPQPAPVPPVPSTTDLTVGRGKKTKTIKRATTLAEDWGVGRLDLLPELHSLDDSGVIDMLLSTKDIELRGPNQMVTWPNGATSRFITAEVNQHIIIYEYSSRLGADRRLVLRVNSKATRFSSRGDAVERHHERILPYDVAHSFETECKHPIYSAPFGNAIYKASSALTEA